MRNYQLRLADADAEGGAAWIWTLIKGLPEDAATWREENRAFRLAKPETKVAVSTAWAMIFSPESIVRKKVVSDPREVRALFSKHFGRR